MPKEILHWMIADEAVKKLNGSALGKAASAFPNCLRLGAVFPDLFFYIGGYRNSRHYLELANAYHGNHGEDTYTILRHLIKLPEKDPFIGQIRAFCAGWIMHIHSDSVFHPLVYYFTGNYNDTDPFVKTRAVQNHRRFETLMDMRFSLRSFTGKKAFLLKSVVSGLEIPFHCLIERLPHSSSQGVFLNDFHLAALKSLKNFQFLQYISRRRILGSLLRLAHPFLSDRAREIAAIFDSPQLVSRLSELDGKFYYRNPVTGEGKSAGMDDLFHEAVERIISFCLLAEFAVLNGDPGLIADFGPSLDFGIVGISADKACYFSPRPFF